tara:strand:+ start:8472 stop:8666 length:195 start_codon:yes stop_codon:yes gene_type:complete
MGEHKPIRFTQSDIKRAAKGLADAGVTNGQIKIDRFGNFTIVIGGEAPKVDDDTGPNEWDDVLK